MGFRYVLEITATLEKQDNGYWSKTPMDEFINKCQDPRNITVLIKEGGTEPKQVPASIRIKQVIVDL